MTEYKIFKAIQIETMDFCNRNCYFCPNSLKPKTEPGIMSYQTFEKITNQLVGISYKGRISPYLRNEPLMDNRICYFITTLRTLFPENIIFINTNGDRLLDNEFLGKLIATGIDAIQINCYDDEKQYNKMVSLFTNMNNYGNLLIHNEHAKLIEMKIRNNAVNISIKKMYQLGESFWNRGGNIPNIKPIGKYNNLRFCSYPSTQMYINYLGEAVLCCSDWKNEVILGNINTNNLLTIWESKTYETYRIMHKLNRGNELPLCNRCNRIMQ